MDQEPLIKRLAKKDVVVFVGAHPDDETLVGPVLAFCADQCRELVVVSLTKGESGWNLAKEDLTQTLAQVRWKEFVSAVRTLGGTPIAFDYVNGTSKAHPEGLAVLDLEETAVARWRAPGGREQTADAIYERWTGEAGDPAGELARLFREKDATIVIALEPEHGVTNHLEHVAATRAVIAAVRECSRQREDGLLLYYVVRPSEAPERAEHIATSELNAAGGKDYGQIAHESRAFYVSQYRPEKLATRRGAEHCLLRATDVE
jgi:LmbE family N-acetylglucosaminyl deacetylase